MKLFRVYEICYNAGEKISNCIFASDTVKSAKAAFVEFIKKSGCAVVDEIYYSRRDKRHYALIKAGADFVPLEILRIY